MIHHLKHRAVQTQVVDGEHSHRDQAHLRERGVRDHSTEIGRAEGEQ